MSFLKRLLSFLFLAFIVLASWQCARRGSPSGGPKDIEPPVLLSAQPENYNTNFEAKKIRLNFDEYIKLKDLQKQLIISPPLKYQPEIKPQGGVSKYIEVAFKDTLLENTTYTINFGESIVDNNEGNPNPFLTYVFSTGDYIDSLTLKGAVKDAYNRRADQFVSVMLYELDTAYTDSTIYKAPPKYITNTLDSLPLFELKNLKEGAYFLRAILDNGRNNIFDQQVDKVAFVTDTITLPTDSLYVLTLFKEVPDYSISVPSYVAKNKIIFGYQGNANDIAIANITPIPDSVQTLILKERDTDSLNYWLTPTDIDSIVFTVTNEKLQLVDTFNVKTRKLPLDSLKVEVKPRSQLGFLDTLQLFGSTPIVKIDTSKVMMVHSDTIPLPFQMELDTVKSKVDFDFEIVDNRKYSMQLLPGAVEDFFGMQNDTLLVNVSTGSYADVGNLRLNVTGAVSYPILVQLTNDKGETLCEVYAEEEQQFEFNFLEPANYGLRVIFDENGNKKWDTGNYLLQTQPEVVKYYPDFIEMRANWEQEQTFIISD